MNSITRIALLVLVLVSPITIAAQKLESFDRDRGQSMLTVVKNRLKNNYYDPTFGGMDLD